MLKLTDVTQALPRMKTGTDLTDALQILPKYDAYIREQDAATRLTALSELYRNSFDNILVFKSFNGPLNCTYRLSEHIRELLIRNKALTLVSAVFRNLGNN